jgi:hypothetical protein
MTDVKKRVSCMELFKKFNIGSLANEYMFWLQNFIRGNMEKFQTNS